MLQLLKYTRKDFDDYYSIVADDQVMKYITRVLCR